MHPLLNLVATRPNLLAEHLQAYADLLADELPRAASGWKRRTILNGMAALCAMAALLFAGTASMLWAALPTASMPAAWLLVVVPLLPGVAAMACRFTALADSRDAGDSELMQQLRADLALLRNASASA